MKAEPRKTIISRRRKTRVLAGRSMAALVMLSLCLAKAPATAAERGGVSLASFQQESLAYQLPRQPLASALKAYADFTNLQLLYRSSILPALTAPSLSGRYTPQEALVTLLEGTGVTYTYGAQGAIVLQPAPRVAETAKDSAGMPQPVVEETYVTGIRSTLKLNLAIKESSTAVVDLVTAEDIGKFPDNNVADALQRVPGVSVDRLWGEGRDVNIRGTHKDLNRTLLNGQHVASAYWWANDNLGRGFNYSTLASYLVQSLEVHKSASADMDEGSIGGTVVVRTRRPFALKAGETHLSYEQHYSGLADAWAPQAAFLTSWKNQEQTWGVLAALNWQNQRTRRDGLETFPDNTLYTITEPDGRSTNGVYSVWGGGAAILQQDRAHTTGNLAVQWVPARDWQLVLNLLRSDMAIDNINHNLLFVPGGYKLREQPTAVVENPRFVSAGDGHPTLVGGTLLGSGSTGAVLDSIYRQAYIETQVNDLDLTYDAGRWQAHLQVGSTEAVGGTEHDYLYRFLGDTRAAFSLQRNVMQVDYLDLDPLEPGGLARFSSDSRDWIRRMENNEDYIQADITLPIDGGFMSAWKLGSKFRDHRVENHRTVGSPDVQHPDWQRLREVGLDAVSAGSTPRLNRGVGVAGPLAGYAWTDEELLRRAVHPYYTSGVMQYRYDASAFYGVEEHVWAHYLKGNFERASWSGNAGVRIVSTRQTARAFWGDQLVAVRNDYRDYLPSLNLRYQLAPQVVVRAAAARVMARPSFQRLSPGIVVDPTSGSGTAGNPQLDPYRANQFDLGAEWYFAHASLLSATAFYKDVSTFVYPETALETIDGEPLYLARPRNLPGAEISGLELQWQQDMGNGIGLLSNYTYTSADVPSPAGVRRLELPGNSTSQFNASVYYEGHYEGRQWSGRVSYNYRSKSHGELIAGSQTETDAYRQWDAQLQWYVNEPLSLSLKGINLTNELIYIRTASGVPQGFYENGRRVMLGVQLDF